MVTHLFGYPCKIDEIKKIAKEKNIFLIEDCAQSFDTYYNNIETGMFGDVGIYSCSLIKTFEGYNFKLYDGKITNIDKKGNFNLGFKETTYEIASLSSKTRKEKKLNETSSLFLYYCLENLFSNRKDENIRCGKENSFLIKDIYEEFFQRIIQPLYIIILSLLSSLIILKSKINIFQNYFKTFLFIIGFCLIIFSELSYKFITESFMVEIIFIVLPFVFVLFFYFMIFIKSKFNLSYL